MYNDFIKRFRGERTLNVKIGDKVNVQGFTGTVLDVFHGFDKEIEKEWTSVRVHFDDLDGWVHCQNKIYGDFTVIEKELS